MFKIASKQLLWEAAGGRHLLLALGVAPELTLLALQPLEEILLAEITPRWLECLGESVRNHVRHRPVQGYVLGWWARGARGPRYLQVGVGRARRALWTGYGAGSLVDLMAGLWL